MTLVLLSGRPGAGKTDFGGWLRTHRGFVHIKTDTDTEWGALLCRARSPGEAVATFNRARALGPKVVIEWGFRVEYLSCVHRLRDAGFDAWWFDGEESAARQGYIRRRNGCSLREMDAYWTQVERIQEKWPELERFYGDHVIHTVTSGPVYKPFDEIASVMFPDDQGT